MFKISDFISSIDRSGVLKSNRYVVEIPIPEYMKSTFSAADESRLLSLRCENANLPGMAFTSLNNVPRFGYGAPETIPYGVTFDNFNLTFLLDARAKVYEYFYEWTNSIVNYRARGQSTGARSGPARMNVYEVGYKDKYVSDIKIHTYDTTDTRVMTHVAYRSYPTFLPTTPLGWGSNDELIKLTIEFSCTDFDVEYSKAAFDIQPI